MTPDIFVHAGNVMITSEGTNACPGNGYTPDYLFNSVVMCVCVCVQVGGRWGTLLGGDAAELCRALVFYLAAA